MKILHSLTALLLAEALSAQSPCLIASYPFDGNANDVTGNGHDGAVTGAVLATDRFGSPDRCYFFDGIDDLIELSDTFSGSNGSFTAWISVANFNVPNQLMVCNGPDATNNHFNLTLSSAQELDGLNQRLFSVDDARQCDASRLSYTISDPALSPQAWTFVAITADGAATHLFINGTEVSTVTDGSIVANNGNWFDDLCGGASQVLIGSNLFGYYSGRMDDAAFYGCALTADQIDSVYQAQSTGQPCLVANYPFNGNATDNTGNGHDGAIHGAIPAPDRFGIGGACLQFNGTSDFIDIPGDWSNAGHNGTISAWIYLDDLDDYRPIFTHVDDPNIGNSLDLNIDCATCQDSSHLWYAFDDRECGGHLYFDISQPKLTAGVWTHVAATVDETSVHLFINCQEVATYTGSFVNPGLWFEDMCGGNYTTQIGRWADTYFKGRIDDLRIYSCALTAEGLAEQCDFNTSVTASLPRPGPSVYPNPTTGPLHVNGLGAGSFLQLFDALGRQVMSLRSAQQAKLVLDLSALPHGIYVLAVDGLRTTIIRD